MLKDGACGCVGGRWERKRGFVCICLYRLADLDFVCVYVFLCVRVCVCVFVRARARRVFVCVCVCLCVVCVWWLRWGVCVGGGGDR